MDDFLDTIMVVFLYIIFILCIPVVMIVATPFVLIWPGRKGAGGVREKRRIKRRYAGIWKIMESIGVGLPTS